MLQPESFWETATGLTADQLFCFYAISAVDRNKQEKTQRIRLGLWARDQTETVVYPEWHDA